MTLTSSQPQSNVRFYLIDALRGIAALWVVLYHAGLGDQLIHLMTVLPTWSTKIVFEWGSLGVPIFFVLSGFVVAYSLRNAQINWTYFRYFLLRRLIRLNPPYYASIFVVLVSAFVASQVKGELFEPMGEPLSIGRFLVHLVYLQDLLGFAHINDVYWTLCLEIQFYLVFCILLGLAQWLERSKGWQASQTVIFTLVGIIAILYPLGIISASSERPVLFLELFYEFLMGVFACWSLLNQFKRNWFYVYVGILLIPGFITLSKTILTCIIVAILLLEGSRSKISYTWPRWHWIQFLGLVSYSLYLTHPPILGLVFFVGYKVLDRSASSELLIFLVAVASSIAFAALMWWLVEKPSIEFSRKIKLTENLKGRTI